MKPTSYLTATCLSFFALAASSYAFADEGVPKIRKAENCAKVSWIPDKIRKFSNLKAKQTDTVRVLPLAAQIELDGGSENYPKHYPERYFIRDQGVETDLNIAPDGQLIGFEKLLDASKSVELCHYDPKRAGLPFDADGISLDINTDIQFLNRSGRHSLEEIKDGLKDGKSHYKKLAGSFAIFVPKMSHIMIKYDDETQPLKFTAMKGETELTDPLPVIYCVLPMIKVKDLESIGADHILISGGDYSLLPVPSLAAMKRFEGCGEDDG